MTPDRKLRWGILGVAKINDRVVPAFKRSAHAEVRAIASRSLDRARQAAVAIEIPVAHGSYEALLADPAIDAVYIPLPNTMHAEWARRAAEAGKHILCEKPLTPTAPQARELIEYCRGHRVAIQDGFMWPHHPRTACIRALIDSGVIGPVRRVLGAFTFLLQPFDPSNIRLQAELAGGCLLDVGCYPVYGIRWAFGAEPIRVSATARFEHAVDVEMSGTLLLADGRIGTFDCGFTTPYRTWLEIVGTEGVIQVNNMWSPDARAGFTIRRENRPPEEQTVEGHDQIVCMIDNFSRSVLLGEPVRPDPEEAVRTLEVLDALALSAREQREIDLEASPS
jgi:predicted dehydrogenase